MNRIARLSRCVTTLAILSLPGQLAVAQGTTTTTVRTTTTVTSVQSSSRPVAFIDVSVVPMDRERVIENQTVIVRDGRIASIGPTASTRVPDGVTQVDGRGKYLMPGLTEMHGHVPSQAGAFAEATMLLFVANGVTTVRGMQGSPYHITLRDAIARGETFGPTFYAAGPQLDARRAATPAAAVAAVTEQKQAGFDLLKIQEGVGREAYDSIVATARRLNIPFGGHVPDDVGLWHALSSKQGTIDHLDNFLEAVNAADFPANHLPAAGVGGSTAMLDRRIAGAAAAAKAAGVAVVPTQALWQMLWVPEDSATLSRRPELRYMPPATLAQWYRTIRPGGRLQTAEERAAWIATRTKILKAVSDAGVPVLLGTDAPQLFSVPGFSIHREMQAMADAAMTPYAILRSGTRDIAAHFGTPAEFGTVEVGRRADLILLDANPLASVANVQRRAGVMLRGMWLPEAELQRRLETLAASYRTP
jgi:imidazolonepropionase-like amidohydrolase